MKSWRYPCGCWFLLVVILTPKHETSPRWAAFSCKFSLYWSFSFKPRMCLIWTQRPWFEWVFLDEFSPFCKKYFQKWIFVQNFFIFVEDNSSKNFTVTYNMEGCLRFYTFIFLILLNLAKIYIWTITNWATSRSWKKTTLPDLV
jgi:hypothetical protein